MGDDIRSIERREFLRKAAATGVVAAWAAPIVQTVAATPAFAQTQGTPGPCQHSLGGPQGGGCQGACQGSSTQGCGSACNQFCGPKCQQGGQGNCGLSGNVCCNDGLCEPGNWSNCSYTGPTAGCTC